MNATTANNMIGQLEGSANLPSACGTNMGTCTSGRNNSYYMAGLAYDAHTKDIRSDLTGSQTISTYWLDVMEGQTYQSKNQYWLAAKYGGFVVPGGFSPYAASNGTGTLPNSAWWTTTELTPGGADKRPDNYFLANQADKMVDGLNKAFAKIVSENDGATTTAFSTPTAKVSTTDGASYAASYEAKTWSGIVTGSSLAFASDGTPTATMRWDARALLDATLPANRKIVTCCTSGGAALPFQAASLGCGHAGCAHGLRVVRHRAGCGLAIGGQLCGVPARRSNPGTGQRRRLSQAPVPARRRVRIQSESRWPTERALSTTRQIPGTAPSSAASRRARPWSTWAPTTA